MIPLSAFRTHNDAIRKARAAYWLECHRKDCGALNAPGWNHLPTLCDDCREEKTK